MILHPKFALCVLSFDLPEYTMGTRRTSRPTSSWLAHSSSRLMAMVLLSRAHPWFVLAFSKSLMHTVFAHLHDVQTSSMLSHALATDLQSIGNKSWALYGTHSFRRGGCQHRIKDNGWTADMVAAWGGWSQVEAVTMFRYFYSPNDNHEFMAEYDRNMPKRQHV